MRVLELFCGNKSIGKLCIQLGWESISLDFEKKYNPTHLANILDWDYKQYPKNHFDIVWASPPCTEYSLLQYSWYGRKKNGIIFTQELHEEAMKNADKIVLRTFEIINYFDKCEEWFVENPGGGGQMGKRDIMKGIPFYDVDYCMYSDWGYRKRTRIWTNKKDFHNLCCDGECGNVVKYIDEKGKQRCLHKTNLGNSGRQIRANKVNVKIYNGLSIEERYRIPEDLVFSLFLM
tara:strand:- start:875 stop:1573 length:699 start_codon:yes stop_codon:yes gene_type:complete